MHLMETTSNSSLMGRKSVVILLNKESSWCCFEENAHVNLRRKYLSYIARPRSAFPSILPIRAFIARFRTLFSYIFQFFSFRWSFTFHFLLNYLHSSYVFSSSIIFPVSLRFDKCKSGMRKCLNRSTSWSKSFLPEVKRNQDTCILNLLFWPSVIWQKYDYFWRN